MSLLDMSLKSLLLFLFFVLSLVICGSVHANTKQQLNTLSEKNFAIKVCQAYIENDSQVLMASLRGKAFSLHRRIMSEERAKERYMERLKTLECKVTAIDQWPELPHWHGEKTDVYFNQGFVITVKKESGEYQARFDKFSEETKRRRQLTVQGIMKALAIKKQEPEGMLMACVTQRGRLITLEKSEKSVILTVANPQQQLFSVSPKFLKESPWSGIGRYIVDKYEVKNGGSLYSFTQATDRFEHTSSVTVKVVKEDNEETFECAAETTYFSL